MFSAQVIDRIAKEVSATADQVSRTIALLNSGNTIPFIARYRKEATGGLDDARLEAIESRNHYFTALEQRRRAVIENIEKLGKLTDSLRAAIEAAMDKNELEDLYLPFKRKRQTRAALGVARGLAPLAETIWAQGTENPETEASRYVDPAKGVNSPAEALQGARDILAERISEDAAIRGALRKAMTEKGTLRAHSTKQSDGQKTKYNAFYDYHEALHKVPAHRLLAILRGNREGALRVELALDDAAVKTELAGRVVHNPDSPSAAILRETTAEAYDRLLRPSMESEVMTEARAKADESAIRVFRDNVKSLLMAPPAGRLVVLGVDPGHKSGCKLAVVDSKSDYTAAATVYPDQGEDKRREAREALMKLVRDQGVQAIALGNGTGCREALAYVRECLGELGDAAPFVALVNEAGASVYSASKLAREEHPDLDVTVRGALSIARRLQDPLSELVKIEPRSIGVGQYQHDVNQKQLREGLHQTVTQCVNQVGVDLNTASPSLLRYVAGIQFGTAQNIVEARRQKGGFKSREELVEIPGIGPKTYEQCAGFLRISGGANPLDNTAVHPESYELVAKMAAAAGAAVNDLIGNEQLLEKIQAEAFISDTLGQVSVKEILKELARPGRDPRRRFRPAKFDENVRSVADLNDGMELEGMVTNVTDFGAFVDIGVGQDGLVHLSELSNRFVRDPRRVVHVGESVRVKVIKIEKDPVRISLSIRALEKEKPARPPRPQQRPRREEHANAAGADGAQRPQRPAPRNGEQRRPQQRHERPARPAAAVASAQENSRPPRDKDRKGKDRPREKKQVVTSGSNEPLNTLLADQLEALRASLGGR